MKRQIAAALGLACWLSPVSGACPTKNCTEAYRRPLEPRELCFAQTAALRAVVEEQAAEIARLQKALEAAATPSNGLPPCKMKGRTRNSAGVCGRW